MASLPRLALSLDMFSLVNSNFKKAPPPPQDIKCILRKMTTNATSISSL